MDDCTHLVPTSLDVASCSPTGHVSVVPAPEVRSATPLVALEAALLPALERPPCVVSFSGGMDSAFVLSAAARLARETGLPAPIPVTWRFTGAPRAEESSAQRAVMATMPGLDWQILRTEEDLDLIGPVAQRVLTRHGVLLPPNVHLHLPILELAAGGALLTGVGGDQMLVGLARSALDVRIRRWAPGHVVAAVRQLQGRNPFPWLHRSVARSLVRDARNDLRHEPRALAKRIAWRARRRGLLISCASLDLVAAPLAVHVVNPLLDANFHSALAGAASPRDLRTRTELLRLIADGRFPDAVIARRPKAHFTEVFLRAATRRFVQSWDGTGADESIVDADALRRVWADWPIPGATAGLVQQLWLSSKLAATAQEEARS